MDDIKISIEGCNTEVSMANNAAEDFAKEAKNSANLALEQANRAKEIVDNSTENIESAKNQAIENAKYSIEEYQTTVLANLENSAGNLKNDMTNSMLTILDSTKQQADIAKYYAEQEHGQSDVTQNDLWTLERKTLFPTFEIRDESNILNELKTQRASSFDKSKFEIVGSPAISDAGVASGFSSSNYITVPKEILNSVGTKSWKIKAVGTFNADTSACYMPALFGQNWNILSQFINVGRFIATNLNFINYITLDVNGTKTSTLITQPAISIDYANKTFEYTLEYNSSTKTYSVKMSFGDVTVIDKSITSDYYLAQQSKDLFIGYNNGSSAIDLSHFSITVDGKEVFSGNKTGLDVIKADDYEVVGSPTITEDGVASGFSSSNYLRYIFSTSISGTKSYDIYGSFTLNSAVSSNEYIFYKIGNAGMALYINSSGQLEFHTGVNGTNTYHTVQLNEKYYYHISYNGTNVKFYYGTNKSNLTEKPLVNGGALTEVDWNTIGLGSAIGYFGFVSGSIDLNAFKIYVDGNLVYQPCLKIPYTLSKTGSKIVDEVYRDRVQGLFEQVGYNGYFTLGENDFTLPTHKFSDIIDCYENGINKWEQRVDRTLRQQGSCTADEEVTLLKPYKDTNYVLNVPYASKTETAFIPTISGDWVANGKVYLD